ncbi:dihydrofolate reductase family protein [Actinomadura sp. NPDC000600]|uniref:dihydrofolate reductase family protein n=1 Tax=Actinomadura sp. NPDC000600 TaxID=3154262 RepID=UPI003395EE08
MSKVTCDIGISVDGFVAGPNQRLEEPLGDGAERLHRWMFEEPEANAEVIEKITSAGAYIMGRNMFGPDRGPTWNPDWSGWWGEEPPYHAPVFVLTHHPRESIPMKGGTTFHFVADGIESAMAQARQAAGDRDVSVAGGASTVNQYLAAGLIDELRLHIAPLVLGEGERLFEGVGDLALKPVETSRTPLVTHVTYRVGGPRR